MSDISDLIVDLIVAGVDPALVGRVAAVCASREVVVAPDEQAQRRREKDRERARVRRHPQTSADLPALPEQKGFPTTFPKTQPSPSTPKENPPLGVKRNGSPSRSRRCPEAWKPEPDLIETLTVEGYAPGELERQLSRFRDHEFPRPYSDWPATFRNWVRRSPPEKATNVHRFDKSAAYLDSLKSVDAAMAEAVRQRTVRVGGG